MKQKRYKSYVYSQLFPSSIPANFWFTNLYIDYEFKWAYTLYIDIQQIIDSLNDEDDRELTKFALISGKFVLHIYDYERK